MTSSMQNLLGFLLYFLFFFEIILIPSSQSVSIKQKKHATLFVFGDSLYDPENNDYLRLIKTRRCNYQPYGETYFKFPTGRCTDGRQIPDFIAMDVKLPLWKPYLGPGKHQFTNGANFASAGAGALPVTDPGTLNLKIQLSFFKEVASILRQQLGDAQAEKLLRNAVYLTSIGGVDYGQFNDNNPNATESAKLELVQWVIGNITDVVKEIYNMGGIKFAFQNVAPMGCSPHTKQKFNLKLSKCLEALIELPLLHNNALFKANKELEMKLPDFKFLIFDYYNAFLKRINNPMIYGFKVGGVACCGRGIYSASGCGLSGYDLCNNPNEYVFFDGYHPTDHCFSQLAELFWNGEMNVTTPLSLKQLFEIEIEPDIMNISRYNNALHGD